MSRFKPCLLTALLFMISLATKAQVAIGTTIPNGSAALDVSSQSRGFLPPRMSLTDRGNIPNPATGLIIYQNTDNTGLYINNGTPASPSWGRLKPEIAPAAYGTFKLTVSQIVAVNATAVINLNYASTNQNLTFSATNHSVTVLTTGTYELSFTVDAQIFNNAGFSTAIYKNAGYFQGGTQIGGTLEANLSHHGYYALNAGDVLTLVGGSQNSANVTINNAYFSLMLLN